MAKTEKAPPAGAKPNVMTDAQEMHLFGQNLAKYERLLDAKKKADKALQDHGKIIKSEHGAHGLLMIKTTIALREPETEIDVKEKADAMVKALRWSGVEIGFQGSLFELSESDLTAEERAYADGKRVGIKGEAMSAPTEYAAGDAYQQWCKGWHDGQESIFAIKKPDQTIN